ncbi:MAG: 30S ribosomal protein S4 [Caldisericaceae bacterium]
MAVYNGPLCRLCRAQGKKLFLKGDKCYTKKCPMERNRGIPGQKQVSLHFNKPTDYKVHLMEKQKVKRMYGVLERQFRRYFDMAIRQKEIPTGDKLLELLERRLDNVVYRLGFAPNRRSARQLVSHGHILVNGKKVDVPSFIVRKGDVVEVKETSRKIPLLQASLSERSIFPQWLSLNKESFRGEVTSVPNVPELSLDINPTLIVELYSK